MKPQSTIRHLPPGAIVLIAALGIVCGVTATVSGSAEAGDEWRTRENLVRRLGGEWYNIGILNRELSNITEVLGDIRDLQLFPQEVTRLTDDGLVSVDRQIAVTEKRTRQLRDEVARLRPELADAVGILSELVSRKPVREMFEVLERGDLARIQEMLRIKHRIDTLWITVDDMLTRMMQSMAIAPAAPGFTGIDQEFFDILKANLGLKSERYYEKLAMIKDSLVARAAPALIREMYQVEIRRLRECVDRGLYELASHKAGEIRRRYESRRGVEETILLRARALFNLGEYSRALELLQQLPTGHAFDEDRIFYSIQCLYALGRTEAVWRWARSADFSKLSRSGRNYLLWIGLESALAHQEIDTLVHLASRSDASAPYMMHVLHTLARGLIVRGDLTAALSVVERGIRRTPAGDEERTIHERLQVMAAHLNYELGRTENALALYMELVKKPHTFEEALLGISWCYIRLEAYDKAESSLRTLINQNPRSPKAVEAILLVARRLVSKAHFEWKRRVHIEQETARLEKTLLELTRKQERVADSAAQRRMDDAVVRTESLLSEVRRRSRMHPDSIAALFKRADAVCGLVARYYETGSFRETTLSTRREQLLYILDSLRIAMAGSDNVQRSSAVARMTETAAGVKAAVAQSRVLQTEMMLNHYRWEREYLDWTKQTLSRQSGELLIRIASTTDSSGRNNLERRRADIARSMDSLVAYGHAMEQRWSRLLVSRIRTVLATIVPSEDAAYLHYHLGELLYAQENARFREQYALFETRTAQYDSLMERFHSDASAPLPSAPQRPVLDHAESIEQYRTVINRYPRSDVIAAARYSLAWCFSDVGIYDSALIHMTIVGRDHPDSRFAPQAWMYIGEHAFDNGRLAEAVEAYQTVMKYPESDWFDEALYKYAWTQYRLSNPEKAISSFLALVDLGRINQGKSFLEKESMDYIAISFSEADPTGQKGLSKASRFVEKFGDLERGTRILQRLAEVYREQGRMDMAERTYRSILERYPTYARLPIIERGLVSVLEKRLSPAQINSRNMEFFEKFRGTGTWAALQRDSTARALGDSLAGIALFNAALGYHQEALQHNNPDLYTSAARAYETYIRAYPSAPNANESHYNLAEIKFSLGDYLGAAQEYIAVSKRYPGSKYQETAAWNAIVSTQHLLKQEGVLPQ